MDITLNQDEIEKAVREFISNQGISINNKLIEISLTAGRGVNGHSASVTIMPAVEVTPQEEEPVWDETPPAKPKKAPVKKETKAKKDKPVVKDALKENTSEFKEQEDESGFEITEEGPVEEPALVEVGAKTEEVEEETDSLFGS